ncbi:hypothetical protein [Paraburkholderia rhizosphaerae]|uniref:Uncharacterized protein n=1 Tax=Paraburkholderia rhizosphaerae TaxID=480658 RepID=A0A4R8KNS5_9BURK|nr:hypothetical protein [Paraburkholderia rhizosphaerae]TDY31251.1 hypothetical protein BX592_1546 [Paraburkholderia rhizosphaerae]
MSDMKVQFLNGLRVLLELEGYAPYKVARYAYEFYLDHSFDDPRLEHVVNFLKGMDAGPEFELSEAELKAFLSNEL